MKKIFGSTFVFFLLFATATEATLLGIHGLQDPERALAIKAKAVRIIVKDFQIQRNYNKKGLVDSEVVQNIKKLHDQGIETIVAVRWPINDTPKEAMDRIPVGEDRKKSLELLSEFLKALGPSISWYQIQNEPINGPGRYKKNEIKDGIQWFKELAQAAKKIRETVPELKNLKIMSPGLTTAVEYAQGNANKHVQEAIEMMIAFANENTDALDIHLHVASVDDIRSVLKVIKPKSKVPLTSMEWSQAKIMKPWLTKTNSNPLKFGRGTNADVVRRAYKEKLKPEIWREFVESSPFDPQFLSSAFSVMKEYGLLHACYGGYWQFGKPMFDMKALVAQGTAQAASKKDPTKNEPFYSEYLQLAASQ